MQELAERLSSSRRALALAFFITAALFVAELVGGILTNSLALLADAGHMASDMGALGLAFAASLMASRPATSGKTFGFFRAEIVAAFINGLTLLAIAGYVLWEASQRLSEPPEVKSGAMLAIASAGLAANLAAAQILARSQQRSLNVKSAYLHVLGDTAGSVGAVAAGLIMVTSGQFLADPAISIAIAGLLLLAAWRLLRESTHILLEGTPRGLQPQEIATAILNVDGVEGIHDLHVWTLTSGFVSLSAHVEIQQGHDQQHILVTLRRMLVQRFAIQHATIQLETHTLHEELEACCGIDMMPKESEHAYFHG